MNIRTLIVDDEPPARELIARLLRDEPDVEIVAQCGDGRSAIQAVRRFSPDLVFLDVQMPGIDGFGVLENLPEDRCPMIVFVTAYNQHAVRAFEVHAVDYVLKPFEYDRLKKAVERVRRKMDGSERVGESARLRALLEEWKKDSQLWDRLPVREAGRVTFVRSEEIDWVEAEGNYVRLHLGKQTHLLRETMGATESRLAAKKFLRISRSSLVNLERVKEWQPLFHGDSVLILKDGTRLTVSRNYREKLDQAVARLDEYCKLKIAK